MTSFVGKVFKIGPGTVLIGLDVVGDPEFWLVTGPKTREPDPLDEGGEGWGVADEGGGKNDVDKLLLKVVLCVETGPNTIAPGDADVCGEFV